MIALIMSLLVVFLSTCLQASESYDHKLIEVRDSFKSNDIDSLKWADYKTDECLMFDTSKANEEEFRQKGLRRCRDGSVSFVQPDSRGAGGWEGKCGQTFGANSLFMFCAIAVDPSTYFKEYFRDFTPGVRPVTIKRGMTKIAETLEKDCFASRRIWRVNYSSNDNQYLDDIERLLESRYSLPGQVEINRDGRNYINNPVGALIQNPGGPYLHWVTIVDILKKADSCLLVVNHWDNQYQVPCTKFSSWSKNVGKNYPLILKSYSLITYK